MREFQQRLAAIPLATATAGKGFAEGFAFLWIKVVFFSDSNGVLGKIMSKSWDLDDVGRWQLEEKVASGNGNFKSNFVGKSRSKLADIKPDVNSVSYLCVIRRLVKNAVIKDCIICSFQVTLYLRSSFTPITRDNAMLVVVVRYWLINKSSINKQTSDRGTFARERALSP